MANIHISQYPQCCGIYVLHNFGHTNTTSDRHKYSVKEVEKDIELKCKTAGVGMYLVALNQDQVKIYDNMMERLGFQAVIEGAYHPGHGNVLNLYAKAHFGTGQREDVKPKKTKDSVFQKAAGDNYW